MIEHIVINGGGPAGLYTYGALKYLCEQNFISMENIKTIYGTSAGAIIGVLVSLKYEWKDLDDYLLKRPWDKVFKIEPDHFFDMYYSKGLFQFSMVNEVLTPLLTANDLDANITLKEFYEYNNIDFHIFTIELNSFEKIDLNHKSYPDLSLLKALEMSSAVPILFKPVIIEDKCYIDGGIIDNYPVYECLKNEQCSESQVIGIKNKWSYNDNTIKESMNIFQFLQKALHNLIDHMHSQNTHIDLKYEVKFLCDDNLSDHSNWIEYMVNTDKRATLINEGIKYAELFLNYEKELNSSNELVQGTV